MTIISIVMKSEEDNKCESCESCENLTTTLCCYSDILHCPNHICANCGRCPKHCRCDNFTESKTVVCEDCKLSVLSFNLLTCTISETKGCTACFTYCRTHNYVCSKCSVQCPHCNFYACRSCSCACGACEKHKAPCCNSCLQCCKCPLDRNVLQQLLEKNTVEYRTIGGIITCLENNGITEFDHILDVSRMELIPYVVRNVDLRNALMNTVLELSNVVMAPSLTMHELSYQNLLEGTAIINLTSKNRTGYYKSLKNITDENLNRVREADLGKNCKVYLYDHWTDFGRIDVHELTTLLQLFDRLRIEKSKVIIHCTAGCGRTGTLIAASMIHQLYSLEKSQFLHMADLIFQVKYFLRIWRPLAIQGEKQELLLEDFRMFLLKSFF